MVDLTEVFTPNSVPTFTYIDRAALHFEQQLRQALSIPNMVVSLSGPSKCGKTVLMNKVVDPKYLIPISGAGVQTPDELWGRVLSWLEKPVETTKSQAEEDEVGGGVQGGVEVEVPLLVKAKVGTGIKGSKKSKKELSQKFNQSGLQQLIKEIGGSSFVVFIDDFHYMFRPIQKDVGHQIKEAAEKRVRICTASVPHRSDDIVRSNPELRGRVKSIDISYWDKNELAKIAEVGFRTLNIIVPDFITSRLAVEAFGSPQLMQTICLTLCQDLGLPDTKGIGRHGVYWEPTQLLQCLEKTSTYMDFSTILEAFHAGPKQRGTDRRIYMFNDQTRGDVYRCVLLAISQNPSLSITYDAMLGRVRSVCVGDVPAGSSITQALAQIHSIAESLQADARVLEWDENTLDIVDPYFLFFLRHSKLLQRLGAKHPG